MAIPVRIIHTLGFPIDYNGNVTRVLGEAISVAKRGYSVDIIVSEDVPRRFLKRAWENGVNFHRLKRLIPGRRLGWRLNNTIPLMLGTQRIVNEPSHCILHVASPTPVTKPFTASEVAKRLGIPMLLDLHDPWSSEPFSLNLIPALQTQIMRQVIKNADYVVVAQSPLAKLVKRIDKDKPLDVIPNGVDSDLFKPRPPNLQLAQTLGVSSDDVVVAFSGHHVEHEGLDILVHSAKKVTQKNTHVKFLIMGDGPERKRIEALTHQLGLRKHFLFTGFIPNETVAAYLSLADICVAPYKLKSWFQVSLPETPLKVVEYMASGKPVLMSEISTENVVTWSGGGILITPGDIGDLTSNILDLVENEELRKTMGKKGRYYVENHLSWTMIAEKLVKIYQQLQPS